MIPYYRTECAIEEPSILLLFVAIAMAENNDHPECTGSAAEVLARYRKEHDRLKREGQRKPDMVAFKRLKYEWAPAFDESHGEISGVPIGLNLLGRGEAAILGIHTQILCGIDAGRDEACYAV